MRNAAVRKQTMNRPRYDILAAPYVTLEVTWWDDDGVEQKGWVSVTPDASLDTTAALVRMMREAQSQGR